ncbi:MAG: hypothetical protein HC910_14965 [Spirulinaceae cyanobacterium SM2_1_0]|nr:hypothetical protein [Spirulinaceae cyanobacterium SM2_1_0]
MRNYLTLSLGLVAGLAIASNAEAMTHYVRAQLAPSAPATSLLAQTAAAAAPVLSLDDLPEGFQELPPTVANQLAAQLEALSGQLSQNGVEPEGLFVYYNPTTFEIIAGLTSEIADPAGFDANLTNFEDEAVREELFAQVQGQLESVGPISVEGYEYLADMADLADKSAGVGVNMQLMNQAFRADITTFRRGSTGAVAAVIYRANSAPDFTLRNLAETLDSKLAMVAE